MGNGGALEWMASQRSTQTTINNTNHQGLNILADLIGREPTNPKFSFKCENIS